jgi:hypothetical protein
MHSGQKIFKQHQNTFMNNYANAGKLLVMRRLKQPCCFFITVLLFDEYFDFSYCYVWNILISPTVGCRIFWKFIYFGGE